MTMKKFLVIASVAVFCCLSCNVNQAQPKEAANQKSEAPPTVQPTPEVTPTAEVTGEPRPVLPTPLQPFDCALIQEESLRSLKFGELGQEEMQQWIEKESPFKGVDIYSSEDALIWQHTKGKYDARFQRDVFLTAGVVWSYWGQTF